MCWEGRERLGNWHSSQLISTLCRKICSIWCYKPKYETLPPPLPQTMRELICLGQGGPSDWLTRSQIITPEVETPSGLLQDRRQQRWKVDTGSLARQTLGGMILAIGPPACRTRGHIPDILLSDSGILVSSQRTQPVWRNEGIFKALFSHHLQTHCGLILEWITRSYCRVHPSLGHQKFISSLFHPLSERSCRRSSLKFQGQVINGRRTMAFCNCCTYMKQLTTEFITNATVARGVNKQMSVQHSRTQWTRKSSVCLQPVQPLKWGQTALSCLAAVCLMLAWLSLFLT